MTVELARNKKTEEPGLYGLMAEFDTPEGPLDAAKRRGLGYRRMDGYSPFPVEGLAEVVGFRFNLLPWLVLGGGVFGACGGYFMQWYSAVVNYPINVGGGP